MDVMNRVREWNTAPEADADVSSSRMQLQRVIAAEARRTRRRRYVVTVGALGGVLGLTGAAVFATGVLTAGDIPNRPSAVPFVPAAAAADEIVAAVATRTADIEIPAGKYLKTTVTFDQTMMLRPDGSQEPFDWVRTGAIGSLSTRWVDSSYISADGAQPIILESSSYQPLGATGDEQAVHRAWDSTYGAAYGTWDDVFDAPRPPVVTDSGIRSDLQGVTDPSRVQTPSEPTDINGNPLVEGEGLLSSDPSEYLDALTATLPAGSTREDGVGEVFAQILNSALPGALPIDPQRLAFCLQVISLSDTLEIESTDGDVVTLVHENDDAVRRLVVNTDENLLLEASERLKRTSGVYAPQEEIGEAPFIPADAPTSVFRIVQEIVDAAPALSPAE